MSSNLPTTGMATIKISLSHHPDKFSPCSQELAMTKKVNFIFGKNGTGKTTISDEILSQLSTDYDVCVFKDFDGVVENDRLNAVALGTTNAKIQKEIDIVDGKIVDIKKQINQPDDQTVENLFTKDAKAKEAYVKQENKINTFFTDSARKIKNISNPQIARTSYDKTSFKDDIAKANSLHEGNIESHKNTIKADKKADAADIHFPNIDLSSCLKSANEILQSSVAQMQVSNPIKHVNCIWNDIRPADDSERAFSRFDTKNPFEMNVFFCRPRQFDMGNRRKKNDLFEAFYFSQWGDGI